jgi:hypothetical protein
MVGTPVYMYSMFHMEELHILPTQYTVEPLITDTLINGHLQ